MCHRICAGALRWSLQNGKQTNNLFNLLNLLLISMCCLVPQDLRRRLEMEILEHADVVCCTCVGAGDPRLQNFRFQHVSCGGKAWGGGASGVRRGRGYRGQATPTCMQDFEFQHVGLEVGEGLSGRGRRGRVER